MYSFIAFPDYHPQTKPPSPTPRAINTNVAMKHYQTTETLIKQALIQALQTDGHEVVNVPNETKADSHISGTRLAVNFETSTHFIARSDIVIAEVTTYCFKRDIEINIAISLNVPVILLCHVHDKPQTSQEILSCSQLVHTYIYIDKDNFSPHTLGNPHYREPFLPFVLARAKSRSISVVKPCSSRGT